MINPIVETMKQQVRNGNDIITLVFMAKINNEITIIPVVFHDQQEKDQMLLLIRLLFLTQGVKEYAYSTFAWMTSNKKDIENTTRPELSAHREEIIMSAHITDEGVIESNYQTVIRKRMKNREKVLFKPNSFKNFEMRGIMAELLEMTPEEKKVMDSRTQEEKKELADSVLEAYREVFKIK